ncbi:hypothetical protein [Ralstonia sp.]|jgi:hypothetical protein|uniref:hypothetical protein n=1 Tax=Ralstonia sp. TaxID=54061 RepID=UPI00397E5327
MQLTITIRWKWIALALLLACVLLLRWAPKGLGRIESISNSPNGVYRVEFWSPSIFSGWGWWNADDPGFVRVYDNSTRKLLGESEIFDMNGNGRIFWPLPLDLTLMVGTGDDAYILKLPPGSSPGNYPPRDDEGASRCRCE